MTTVLADALCYRQKVIIAASLIVTPATLTATLLITFVVITTAILAITKIKNNKLFQQIDNLEQKMDNIVGIMESMMGRIM